MSWFISDVCHGQETASGRKPAKDGPIEGKVITLTPLNLNLAQSSHIYITYYVNGGNTKCQTD